MKKIRHLRRLESLCVVALVIMASCGGDGGQDSGAAPTDSGEAATATTVARDTVVSTERPEDEPAPTTAEATPTFDVSADDEDADDEADTAAATVCREGDVPDPEQSALDAPSPVVALDEEPSWVIGLREPRVVDGAHLTGDLEREMGMTAPVVLEPGEHRTDSLGGSSTLALEEAWRLMRADPGLLVFRGAEDPLLQDRPTLLVGWARGLPSPEAAASLVDSPVDQTSLTAVPDDLTAWLDDVAAISVVGCSPIQLFGENGVVYDVAVDPEAGDTTFCMPVGQCVTSFGWYTGGPATDTTVHLSDRNAYRIWHVPHERGALVAVAFGPPDEFADWAARSARLLVNLDADLSTGPPLSDEQFGTGRGIAAAGPIIPLTLPDLTVQLTDPAWAATFARSFIVGSLDGAPPWQDGPYGEVFVVDTGVDGPITSVEDALAALSIVGTVEQRPDEMMLRRPAAVVSVTADEATRVFRTTTAASGTDAEEQGFGWWWVDEGTQTVWLVPVDGRLFAVAATPGADGDLDATVEFTRSVFGDAAVNTTT